MVIGEKRALKVFLCHASGDKPQVRTLYKRLLTEGVDAWLDQEKLLPGQDWRVEIPRAVQEADVVVVCLSTKSITKEGYIQKEIKFALDSADEKPDGTIFLIPARLEDCIVPEKLSRWQWVDLFEDNGYIKLLSSLKLRADKVGAAINSLSYQDGDAETERRLDQYYTEGLAAFYTEDWEKACQRFQLILREKPNYKAAIEKLEDAERQRDLSKLYAQSVDAYQKQDWLAAIKSLEELLKRSPDYKDSALLHNNARKQKQLNELYAEAKRLYSAEKWQAVIKVFEQISIIDSNSSDPDGLLPTAQREVAELKRLSDLNGLYSQAVREMDAGKWYEARRLLEQVHKAQTGFLETERLLKKIDNEISKIEEDNQRINQINTLYEQAHGLVRTKSWRKALDKIEEIYTLDSLFQDKDRLAEKSKAELEREDLAAQKQDQLAAMYADAVRLLKEGKYQESLEKLDEVKVIDPKYPDRQWVQRTLQRKLGEKKRAQNWKFSLSWKGLVGIIVILASAIVIVYVSSNFIYYDRFNNDIYDTKINANLWSSVVSPPSYIKQQDGVLILSVGYTRAFVGVVAKNVAQQTDKLRFVESDVLLSSNKTGNDGDVSVHAQMLDANGKEVNFTCVISSSEPISAWCEVYGRTSGAEYSTIKIPTSPDVWHTFRIELAPDVEATFFIDGQQVGTYKPNDAKDLENRELNISLEAYSPVQGSIEGHFDNVKISK